MQYSLIPYGNHPDNLVRADRVTHVLPAPESGSAAAARTPAPPLPTNDYTVSGSLWKKYASLGINDFLEIKELAMWAACFHPRCVQVRGGDGEIERAGGLCFDPRPGVRAILTPTTVVLVPFLSCSIFFIFPFFAIFFLVHPEISSSYLQLAFISHITFSIPRTSSRCSC
jgi:hypothetical protein